MYTSAHYQWQCEALYDAAYGPLLQGKISDAFNSLGDVAQLDPVTGAYPTSRPGGAVDDTSPDNKLFPFKYARIATPSRGRSEI